MGFIMNIKKEIAIGIFSGFVATALGVLLYIWIFSDLSIDETLSKALEEGYLGKIMTLGAVLNIVTFFVYLRKKQDYRARGVIIATLIIALSTVFQFFI